MRRTVEGVLVVHVSHESSLRIGDLQTSKNESYHDFDLCA